MNNTKIAKNTFFLYVLTFSNYFIGLLLYPYISRVLSVENFGLIGFSMSFVQIFQVIIEFGFMISSIALISKNRDNYEEVSKIVSTTMLAKVILRGYFFSVVFNFYNIYINVARAFFNNIFIFHQFNYGSNVAGLLF